MSLVAPDVLYANINAIFNMHKTKQIAITEHL